MSRRAQLPDGTILEFPDGTADSVMDRAVKSHMQGAHDNRPESQWQGIQDTWAKANANVQRLLQFSPFAPNVGGNVRANAIDAARQRYNSTAPTKPGWWGSTGAGIAATLPTAVIPNPAAQGALSGLILSDNLKDPKTAGMDAVVGAGGGILGNLLGKYVAAPIARRVVNTVSQAATGKAAVPVLSKAERTVVPPANIQSTLADAQRLGVPISLADTDPKLRSLAGSVSRFSPDAKTLAEQTYGPRALGQADRAVNAIDTHLAPVTNIAERQKAIMDAGAAQFGPLYDTAYQAPPITSPRLQQILDTPAGKSAVARARTIAANEFRDPTALGFVVDKDGNVVLNPTATIAENELGSLSQFAEPQRQVGYTPQSLDYVKRALDDQLEPYRDQFSGKLKLDEAGRAINGVKNELLQQLDNLNPDYAAARQSYQQFAQQRDALSTGHDVLASGSVPQRSFDAIMSRATPETLPEFQRGYATAMADQANRMRLTGNPYNAVYGSPDQQAKIAALFPEGAQDFSRVAQLEGDMAKTGQEVLGGSQTQPRAVHDAQFAGGGIAGDLGEGIITGALTGNPMAGAASGAMNVARRTLANNLADKWRIGLSGTKAKADALAPILFNTNPAQILAWMDEAAAKRAAIEAQRQSYADAMGRLAVIPGAVGLSGLSPALLPSN